jgi:hypothetical protein
VIFVKTANRKIGIPGKGKGDRLPPVRKAIKSKAKTEAKAKATASPVSPGQAEGGRYNGQGN